MRVTFCNGRSGLNGIRFPFHLSLIVLGALIAGCSPSSSTSETPEPRKDGKIVIRGSNTVGEELAPHLIAVYKKDHPTADFDVEFKGSAYGMGYLSGGMCDIAAVSRSPSKEEQELASIRNVELNENVIGVYSVAVVVNVRNPVTNLTRDQVRDIFTGAVQNWKEVGGPDAAIQVYVRDPISGTHLGFRELAMENKDYAHMPKTFTNYVGIVEAVAQDANGIGYSSFQRAKSAGVKAVMIGGVEVSAAAVNKGDYPYARVLRLYTNKANESPAARDFVQFVQSSRGQEIVDQVGFLPHP